MITRDNYEAYFVDYLEGNLPETEIDQFLDFLNQNPDLKEELHLFEEVVLPEETLVFGGKEKLHKKAADENQRFENKAIAHMEGDLSDSERESFESYIATQPKRQKEYELFAKTKLVPDLSIQFPAKSKLYHRSAGTIVLGWVARAAAVVALIWGINSVLQTTEKPEIAQNKTELTSAKPTEIQTEPLAKTSKQQTINIQEKENVKEQVKPALAKPINKTIRNNSAENKPENEVSTKEPATQLAVLPSINARIETEQELHLAVKQASNVKPINESARKISVEEFLAMRAQKLGKEGLFSAQRIARFGLSIASEISGDRIGYKEKDGKITSVEFESKLMAFSIPLEKK